MPHPNWCIVQQRGGNISNCRISYNLDYIPMGDLTVSKEVERIGAGEEYTERIIQTAKFYGFPENTKLRVVEKTATAGQRVQSAAFRVEGSETSQADTGNPSKNLSLHMW